MRVIDKIRSMDDKDLIDLLESFRGCKWCIEGNGECLGYHGKRCKESLYEAMLKDLGGMNSNSKGDKG